MTPSSCTLSGQSSFALHPTNFLYLFPTFVARIIQLLMLCPVFRCPSFATLPLRRTWNRLQFLSQPRPSGRSPSLPSVPSHRAFHTPCLLGWNSQDPFPASELQLRYFASWLSDQVSFPTIKLYLAGIRFAHRKTNSCSGQPSLWPSLAFYVQASSLHHLQVISTHLYTCLTQILVSPLMDP